jgi:hypothetical protein
MKVSKKYFIGDKEYSGFELVKTALEFGWKGTDKGINGAVQTDSAITNAVEYLKTTKQMTIRELWIHSSDPIKPPEVHMIPKLPTPALMTPNDNSIMTVYYMDSAYSLDTKLLGEECWDLQIFGNSVCIQCSDRDKPEQCCGGVSLEGKNSLGNEIPIAKLTGKRLKRENGKEEVVNDNIA